MVLIQAIRAPNAKSLWKFGSYRCLNIFRRCSSSNSDFHNSLEVLDGIPDILFSALRLGPAGCSVGQQNRNSFTSGYIDVEHLINQNTKNTIGTTMKSLFSESIHNIKNGVDLKKYEVAVSKLNKFLKNKDYHEECISRGIDKALESAEASESTSSLKHSIVTQTVIPECTVAVLLAVHLLSQLTAAGDHGLKYVVADDYSRKPEFCPCGCELKIKYASTLIGSVDLFYGKPDILLFPEEKERVMNIIIMHPDAQVTFPVPKSRMRKIMRIEKSQSLQTDSSFNQVALETITCSFFHRIFQEKQIEMGPDFHFKTSLVPTIAICDKGFNICMYDSINDVFIKNHGPPIPLFHPNDQSLRISSLVHLWLAINHSIFQPSLGEKENLLKGSFGLISRFVNRDIYERIKDSMDMYVQLEKNKMKEWGQYNVDLLDDLESVDFGHHFKKI